MSNDYTAFGLVNAVTRCSQDIPDYNRATELERLGGTLLDESVKLNKVIQDRGRMAVVGY